MRRQLQACLIAGSLLVPAAAAAQEAEATVEQPAVAAPSELHAAPALADLRRSGDDMRVMVITMGAMAGYMVVAMPVTLPAIAAGAIGGLAARFWYDRTHPVAPPHPNPSPTRGEGL